MLAQMELKCTEQGCGFYAQNKAGLVNHQRQKHRAVSRKTSPCPHCGEQGLYNHVSTLNTTYECGLHHSVISESRKWMDGWMDGVCASVRVCVRACVCVFNQTLVTCD